jgi:hypothetical protein
LKEVYILATEQPQPVSLDLLRPAFESEEVKFEVRDDGQSFLVHADESRIEIRFEARDEPFGWTPDLLTGSEEAHEALRRARGFYRIAFEPGIPQASVAVFEALWCARAIMEHVPAVLLDVTAYKIHDPEDVAEITELDFDIRDHINLHAVMATSGETPLWVHTHGMDKFGMRDVEVFHLSEEDLMPAESFLHELCTDLAFGQGPKPRELVETSAGDGFMVVPSEDARVTLMGLSLETFEGHEGLFFTVVSPEGRHNITEILKPYRGRFEKEPEEKSEFLRKQAQALLPSFKARFQRKGLMEPLTFLVRASFEVHPEGTEEIEHLWFEVLTWEDGTLVGKLVDGAMHTTEWRKGAHVEVEEDQVDAIALGREGRTLDEAEMMSLLIAERPM